MILSLQQTVSIFQGLSPYPEMRSIVYIISDIDKAVAFEWIAESFQQKDHKVQFILLNPDDSKLERFLLKHDIWVERVTCRGKLDWLIAIRKIQRTLKWLRPDIVHCHLQAASIIGLLAAKIAGVKHRIYTRHHSTLHHVYFRKGIFWDNFSNLLATRIVAISEVVRTILVDWERVSPKKVVLIPHGFRLSEYVSDNPSTVALWKKKHGISQNVPIIGVVSRFTEWKGIQYIIPAFNLFLVKHPEAVLLLFNARGEYKSTLNIALSRLPQNSFRRIEFEDDMKSAYGSMDIFIHVPIDDHSEAFGQIYVEALAAGKPSIFTLSGIAPDFIRDEENALVVPFRDSEAIYFALIRLCEDQSLRNKLSKNGPLSVKEKFDLPIMVNALGNLYKQCLTP
jgi:glycosyltransferase involved in cell wall biosynthesis